MAAFLTIGAPGGDGPGVGGASAAVNRAAAVTAASARLSGTAVVRITHDGQAWAGKTVRWNDGDVAVVDDAPRRPGRGFRVVGGTLYAFDLDGGWEVLGDPDSIDPGSGTAPDEYVAATRDDIGGATLRRISAGMTALTTRRLDDGSTVFSGTAAAGTIATGSGFKEGRPLRLFPYGYVAHDEAADPAAPLDVALTVGADGIIRRIAVDWATDASAWKYTVAYSDLGATPPVVAPQNARSIIRERLRGGSSGTGPGAGR